VFSPLGHAKTNLALAELLEPALWILIAPDRLGVLHDVTATLQAMRTLSRIPDFILLSQGAPTDESTGSNAGELTRLGIAEIGAVVTPGGALPVAFLAQLIDTTDRRKL
jgi:dethiobiotin synthetase